MRRQAEYSVEVDKAIDAILAACPNLVGDNDEARRLIQALVDQSMASRKVQDGIAALLDMPPLGGK